MDLITPAVTLAIGLLIGLFFWWQASQQRVRDVLSTRGELEQLRRQLELRQAELAGARSALEQANAELVQTRETARKQQAEAERIRAELAVVRNQFQIISKENDTLKFDMIMLQSVKNQNEQLQARIAALSAELERTRAS
jgi:uncharacterized protein (DUF3084 family)